MVEGVERGQFSPATGPNSQSRRATNAPLNRARGASGLHSYDHAFACSPVAPQLRFLLTALAARAGYSPTTMHLLCSPVPPQLRFLLTALAARAGYIPLTMHLLCSPVAPQLRFLAGQAQKLQHYNCGFFIMSPFQGLIIIFT